MKENIASTIQTVFEDSNNGNMHFGEVIKRLIEVDVESYHVDYRSGKTTYFLSNGQTVDFSFDKPQNGIAKEFNGDEARSAIRGAQQGQLMYPEFKNLSQAAGCSSYTVWIAGRHVSYYGRKGETHVEHFPN